MSVELTMQPGQGSEPDWRLGLSAGSKTWPLLGESGGEQDMKTELGTGL